MDDRVDRGVWDYCDWVPVGAVAAEHLFRAELFGFDRCGVAAERQGGGPRWRFRRGGQPDGVRTARRGFRTFTGDHMVRSDVHGMRDGDGGTRGPQRGARRIDFAEVFEAGPGRDEANSGEPGSCDPSGARSAAATIIDATTAVVDASAAFSFDASEAVSFRLAVRSRRRFAKAAAGLCPPEAPCPTKVARLQ